MHRLGRVLAGVAALALVSLTGYAQSQSQAPVFRSGVDRVAVDFLAVGSGGRPISDLTTADLSLKVDGRIREIKTLEFVRLVEPAPASPLPSKLPPAEAVPQPFGSNAPADAGRAIILVFHHTSLRPGEERAAKTAAATFIGKLSARDRVALVTYQEGGVVVDLTTDHARVLTALNKISGHAPIADGDIPATTAGMAANESAFAVKNLIGLMNSFASIDGPKTVVFISAGLPAMGGTEFRSVDRAFEYQEVGHAAAKARIQLYVIQAHSLGGLDAGVNHPATDENGLSNNGMTSGVGSGLEMFAGVSGGAIFSLSGAATSAFDRVNAESSGYYLLSFDAEANERDGKTHKIAVATSRAGLMIRSRPEFLIPKQGASTPATATQTRTLLKNLETHRDLPLRAVAYSFRSATAQSKVTLIVSTDSPAGIKLADVSYAVIDEKGKIVAQWDADANDLSTTPVVSATTIAPGKYRVRVAAASADGLLGAVDYEFKSSLGKAGPLTFGGLMLGRLIEKRFVPQIDFTTEDSATAYVEVYGKVPPGQQAAVAIEVAATADGPAIMSFPAAITTTRDADRWIATAEVPVAKLTPGDHVIRAVLTIGKASGTMVRTLRKR